MAEPNVEGEQVEVIRVPRGPLTEEIRRKLFGS